MANKHTVGIMDDVIVAKPYTEPLQASAVQSYC